MRVTVYRQHLPDGSFGPPQALLGDERPEGEGWFVNAKADLSGSAGDPYFLLHLGRAFLVYSMYHAREPKFLAYAIENFRSAATALGYSIPLASEDATWRNYDHADLDLGNPRDYRFLFREIALTYGPSAALDQAKALDIEWPGKMTPELLAEKMKQEIVEDALEGILPPSVRSYEDLHEYVDANCYGGTEELLEDLHALALPTDQGRSNAMISFCDIANPAMEIVDAWIKDAGIRLAIKGKRVNESPRRSTPQSPDLGS